MPQIFSQVKHLLFDRKRKPDITEKIKQKYQVFVKLLAENDYALELVSELQSKYHGNALFTIPYLQGVVKKLLISSQNIVHLLNELTDGRYQSLEEADKRIAAQIRDVMTGKKEPVVIFTSVSLDEAYREIADKIGDKMANLGEMKNRLGLPVPDGFAITVCAYNQFLEYNGLDVVIPNIIEKIDKNNPEALAKAEQTIKGLILKASIPPELSEYLHEGYNELARDKPGCFVSIRSSALGEDGEASFAGQYTTLLNVSPHQLESAYKEVVASKYNARAIFYRMKKGYRDEDVAMSAGVVEMVNAKTAGVIYTEDPNRPNDHRVIITAVWGLGQMLVDGQGPADIYILHKESQLRVLKNEIPVKRVMIVPNPHGGVQKAKVPEENRDRPCLDHSALEKLLQYAMTLENHYNWPQDIEWAIDETNQIYLLQTRPLSLAMTEERSQIDLTTYPVLLKGGKVSCGGLGAGPVFRYRTEHDLALCPEGAVLVAGRTSPRFVKIMDKVRAIVTNLGSPTDHMSCLAREFNVPTIVDTREATKRLAEGIEVVVDATNATVYKDIGLYEIKAEKKAEKAPLNIKDTEAYRLLKRLIPLVAPLHLLDPRAPEFSPENCTSVHDIIRFAHESALDAMFSVGETTKLKKKAQSFRLDSDIPLPIYVIDIEGDIVAGGRKKTILPTDIKCEIFQALWKGLTHEKIPWKALSPGNLDLKGFFSAMTQTMVDTLASEQQMGENYILLAQNYLSASFRFGYHFATLDAYVCHNIHDNYVSLTFKGGAAPENRRARRVKFIRKVLADLDFTVDTKEDFLRARVMYAPKDQCLNKVDMLGRLLGCTRYLDMALTTEALVDECVERFKRGDYSLGIFEYARSQNQT